MTGFVSLDPATGWILITFPYDPSLVELVRTIPGRKWDPQKKTWRAPRESAPRAVELLKPRNFSFAPEVLELVQDQDPPPRGETAEGALTVSQLNYMAKSALNRAFPEPLWLVGEVNRPRPTPTGYLYLDFVEKRAEGEGVAARVAGIVYPEELLQIRDTLLRAGGLELSDGLEVRVLVQVDLYPPRGTYQVRVLEIDPYFTLGKLAARREEILSRLKELGLLERNRNLPWPRLPLRVALVTSWDSNAFHDFTGVLRASGFAFQVDVFHARVQGRELEEDVLRALAWFEKRSSDYDLLAIVRGGGSASDLAWFDNLRVALAAARHPLKILVGIGHTLDRTVLDEIAFSARTPTEAGEFLVRLAGEESESLERTAGDILLGAEEILGREKADLASLAQRTARALKGRIQGERRLLRDAALRAGRGTLLQVSLEKERLLDGVPRILRLALARLAPLEGEIRSLGGRILKEAEKLLALEGEVLEGRARRIQALDPKKVLQRGFALVRDAGGRIVNTVARVAPGDALEVEVSDGRFPVKVGGGNGGEKERG